MVSRKRRHEEMEVPEPTSEPSLLVKIRNTWEFANLMQYIYIFGQAVKIGEDIDIEDLEQECVRPGPSKLLSDIGLALLKSVSSHRGLTPDNFDEYTRRQYAAKAPQRNPFGEEDEPTKFADFDVFTKLKVLVQLSQWTLINADRIREKMDERGELEQSIQWRINEIGYDREDRYYFALDDNRLYRRTEAPPPPAPKSKPKPNSKQAKVAAPASKRRKMKQADQAPGDADVETPQPEEPTAEVAAPPEDDGFGGRKWECVAITLTEYQDFLQSLARSRDPDEKALHKRVAEDILPIIEQAEASQLRKKQKREREELNLQKLATAKRSSRLEAKMEKEREDREALEAEQKRKAELAEAEAYKKRQEKSEMDRESRMMTREQRIKEREMKRILHAQELARMSEDEKKVEAGETRLSERHLKAEMDKRKKKLGALDEEDEWTFDCSVCGKHGTNWDDGTHSVACEKCNVWQHCACLGLSQADTENDDFYFVCHDCKRREEDAKKPKIPSLKFRVGASTSPPGQKPKAIVSLPGLTKKHKLDDWQNQQHSHKKHKTSELLQQPAYIQSSQPSQAPPNGVHFSMMSAGSAGTQGEPAGAQRSPQPVPNGQAYPRPLSHGSAQVNGNHQPQPNGYGPPNQSFQPPPFMTNDYRIPQQHVPQEHTSAGRYGPYTNGPQGPQSAYAPPQAFQHSPQQPGRSTRYVPALPHPHSDTPHGAPPAEQNPFANTMNNHQHPSSSYRSMSSQGISNGVSASDQKPPSLSPSQYRRPSHSSDGRPSSASARPHINGFTTHDSAANQPIGPPSQSPTKQVSPSPIATRPPQLHAPSSSPVAHQPSFPANGPSSPGFSPVKQDSPPQHSMPPGHGIAGNPTTLAPTAKLIPSPLQWPPLVPLKPLQPQSAPEVSPSRPQQEQQ